MNKLTKLTTQYTQVQNAFLADPNITMKAKLLYIYINSKPENWDFSVERISTQMKEGERAVRNALKELKSFGLVSTKPSFNQENKVCGQEYTLHEYTPSKCMLKQHTLEQHMLKGGMQSNKEYRKKEIEIKRERETPTPHFENQELKKQIIQTIQAIEPTFGVNYSSANEIVNFLVQIPDRNQYIVYLAAKNSAYFLDVKRITEWEYAKYKQGLQNTQAGTKSNPDVPYYDPNFPIEPYRNSDDSYQTPGLTPEQLERFTREMNQYKDSAKYQEYATVN